MKISTEGLQPGIYFNLDASVYHADSAISRSDLVNMLDTPYSYWQASSMNSDRRRGPSSDAMEYGEAFHCLLFETAKFEHLYQVVPIDAWAEHKRKIQHEDYFAMVESIKVLKRGADSKLFLSGGMPEVTIVFDEGGLRFRTRHDYFTPVVSVDFKTSYTLADQHIKRDFERYGYDIQLALYKRARRRFKEQFAAGEAQVYGKVSPAFFEQFMTKEMNEFIFIFQRKSPPYPYIPLMPEDDTEDNGNIRIDRAVEIYCYNLKKYGSKPWPVCEGKVKGFSMFYGIKEAN